MVHLERAGKPFSFLLDIIELPKSHTGENLATAFVTVLQNFGVDEKVRVSNSDLKSLLTYDMYCRSLA